MPQVRLAQTWSVQESAYWVERMRMLEATAKLIANCVWDARLSRRAPSSNVALPKPSPPPPASTLPDSTALRPTR